MFNIDDSCVVSQISDELFMIKILFGVWKFKFDEDENEKQDDYQESVGSCVGFLFVLYCLVFLFVGLKLRLQNGLQFRKFNFNFLKEIIKVNFYIYGNF